MEANDVFDMFSFLFKPEIVEFPEIECVYFVYAKSQSLLKIGYSKNPLKRLQALSRNVPFNLELLAIRPGGRDLEKAFHRKFKSFRVKGEWFRCEAKSAEAIRDIRNKFPREWNLLAPHFPDKPFVRSITEVEVSHG